MALGDFILRLRSGAQGLTVHIPATLLRLSGHLVKSAGEVTLPNLRKFHTFLSKISKRGVYRPYKSVIEMFDKSMVRFIDNSC